MYLSAYSAKVTSRNTPESDELPEVLHTVKYHTPDGQEGSLEIMAADPMDAIRKVGKMTIADIKQ